MNGIVDDAVRPMVAVFELGVAASDEKEWDEEQDSKVRGCEGA